MELKFNIANPDPVNYYISQALYNSFVHNNDSSLEVSMENFEFINRLNSMTYEEVQSLYRRNIHEMSNPELKLLSFPKTTPLFY